MITAPLASTLCLFPESKQMLLLLLLILLPAYAIAETASCLVWSVHMHIRLLSIIKSHMAEHGRKKLSKPALRPTRPAFYGQYYIQGRPHVPIGVHVCSMYHTAAHRRSLILYYYSTNYNNNCSNSAVQCN